MAAVKRNSRKGRKNSTRKSIFCFFGGCFGSSNKVSSDHGDGKLTKDGSKGRTVPVNDWSLSMSTEIIRSSREIHVVEAEEETSQLPAAPGHEVTDNRTADMTSKKKSKSLEDESIIKPRHRIAQETWTKPAKLSHSVSLPLPPDEKDDHQMDKKGKKGKRDKEIIIAGEFDSIFGALIITVTLMVMLIWGKACAILCTAAWFYFLPRIRANIDEDYARNGKNHVDLDSREYKKKVVLQGLLDRNQHF